VEQEGLGLHDAGSESRVLSFLGRPEAREGRCSGCRPVGKSRCHDAGENANKRTRSDGGTGVTSVGANAARETGICGRLYMQVLEDDIQDPTSVNLPSPEFGG